MIYYKLYKNNNQKSAQYGKWYARAVSMQTLNTADLAEHMANHNSPYSEGVIHGVLTDMLKCIKELVLDGKSVKLDDLAIFSVGIRTTPSDSPSEFTVSNNVKSVWDKGSNLGESISKTSSRLPVFSSTLLKFLNTFLSYPLS